MALDAPAQFHCFDKLPLELQFRVWHESVRQEPRRVYELYDHDPVEEPRFLDDFDSDMDSDDESRLMRDRAVAQKFDTSDISLYERSVVFQRPLLEVDKKSRGEILRAKYYKFVKFLNAHVYINMDVDVLYIGYFHTPIFAGSLGWTGYDNPFWKNVKHVAFGMLEFYGTLRWTAGDFHEDRRSIVTSIVKTLEVFPALETVELVLDVLEPTYRRTPKVNGSISFGDPYQVTTQKIRPGPKFHHRWMTFLYDEWERAGRENPEWNLPLLEIKSISRGGRLQYPSWEFGGSLPDFLHRERRIQDRILVEQDSSESGMEPETDSGGEAYELEGEDEDEDEDED